MATVTTLTYVRTPSGVVQVLPGDRVPDDAIPGELDRLAEVLVDEAPVVEDEPKGEQPKAKPRRKGSRGS